MNPLLILISLFLVVIGISIVVKADRVSTAVVGFYRNYPLIRYVNQEQFVVKRTYVIVFGLVVVAIGIGGFVSIAL
jgi:hypothetical protein